MFKFLKNTIVGTVKATKATIDVTTKTIETTDQVLKAVNVGLEKLNDTAKLKHIALNYAIEVFHNKRTIKETVRLIEQNQDTTVEMFESSLDGFKQKEYDILAKKVFNLPSQYPYAITKEKALKLLKDKYLHIDERAFNQRL